EVLAALRVAGLGSRVLAGFQGERGHGDLVHGEGAEAPVGDGVGRVPRLGQGPVVEGVHVDDEDAPGRQVVHVRLQGRGVHGHQDVGGVPGGEDVVVGDV